MDIDFKNGVFTDCSGKNGPIKTSGIHIGLTRNCGWRRRASELPGIYINPKNSFGAIHYGTRIEIPVESIPEFLATVLKFTLPEMTFSDIVRLVAEIDKKTPA